MSETLFIIVNEKKARAVVIAREFSRSALQLGYKLTDTPDTATLAVSIGGDGTVLRAARRILNIGLPLAHINTGTLGFMGVDSAEFFSHLKKLPENPFRMEERIMLCARCEEKEFLALNDIVIKNGCRARVIQLRVSINGEFVYNLKGDGLIISTPTGSTAYSLAAGGPVSEPGLEIIILTPLNPHSLSFRPTLLSSDTFLEIEALSSGNEIILTADGQVSIPVNQGGVVSLRVASKRLKIAKPEKGFFSVLSEKMNWGA